MSAEIRKASAEAVEAAKQSERYAEILAVVAAVQAAQQSPQPCQHHHPAPAARSSWTPGKVAACAGAVCVGGAVAATFFLAAAIAFPSIAASLLVLWKLYQAVLGGKR